MMSPNSVSSDIKDIALAASWTPSEDTPSPKPPQKKARKSYTKKMANGANGAAGGQQEDVKMVNTAAENVARLQAVDYAPQPQQQMPMPPLRAFEIGELVKLVLHGVDSSTNVIVKIQNHALPHADGGWQYCLKADCIMPGGTGVIWVDEHNLQKVNYLDMAQGTRVTFSRGEMVFDGVIKGARQPTKGPGLLYDVDYTCQTTIGMKDILKVTGATRGN